MKKTPEEDEDLPTQQIDDEVREFVEELPGYQEYQREQRGDSLTFGDW